MAQVRNNLAPLYQTNGAAAYDIYGSAAPRRRPVELPEERQKKQKRVRVRAKAAVSPFAVLGMMAAGCLLVMVIYSYVQLYEATSRVSALNTQLETLEEEQSVLQNSYESKMDLAAIEQTATAELGMTKPNANQIVTLNLSGVDRAEIYEPEETSQFMTAIRAVTDSFLGLLEYFK